MISNRILESIAALKITQSKLVYIKQGIHSIYKSLVGDTSLHCELLLQKQFFSPNFVSF